MARVLIQNQHGAGKIAKKWDKSGMILEHLGFNKYRVKIDGSGRVTNRNRQFLRKFTPLTPSLPGPSPNSSSDQQVDPSYLESQTTNTPARRHSNQQFDPTLITPETPLSSTSPTSPTSPSFETPPSSPVTVPMSPEIPELPMSPETPVLPRRSGRVSPPPEKLTYDRNYRQILE